MRVVFIFYTQTIAPLVDERGVDLQPNTLTQIAIQENKINRLPRPYLSKCYSTWDQSDYPEITDQQPYLDYTVAVSDVKNAGVNILPFNLYFIREKFLKK